MNFDDYENHIVQKYRLAVAIAIIRNTPENYTPKTYLERFRRDLIAKMETYDPDVTICEDDFDFNDDANYDNVRSDNDNNLKDVVVNKANNGSQANGSQMNDSVTILKDFDFNEMIKNIHNDNDTDLIENNSVSHALKILKGVDNGDMLETEITCSGGINLNHTQSTYYESSQSQLQRTNIYSNEDNCETQQDRRDIYQTANNSQHGNSNLINDNLNHRRTNIDATENTAYNDLQILHNLHGFTDNFTHVSQSQFDSIVLPRYLLQKERPKDNKLDVSVNNTTQQNVKVVPNTTTEISNFIQINENAENKKHKSSTQGEDNLQTKRLKYYDSKLNSNPDNNTAYVNDIKTNLNVKESHIQLNLNNKTEPTHTIRNLFAKSGDIVKETTDCLLNIRENDAKANKTRSDKENSLNNFGSQNSVASSDTTYKFVYDSQTMSQFSQDFDFGLSNDQLNVPAPVNPNNLTKQNKVEEKIVQENINEETTLEEFNEEHEEHIIEELYDKLTDSQSETVPFKVLEELSKIKAFLAKRDGRNSSGCVSDSGYKSDSQSRGSLKSALQCSNVWLNQSAHCLLTFLTTCPLTLSTEDITNEISRTLGRLIDKLHEEEKYPSFLEELLLTVDGLLKEIYEEEADASQLLKKDESIHRLFLLNKSSHIIKYTTEKIILILEDVLKIITEVELVEITHTNLTENLSYIFHILETLLKKLIVFKNYSSQTSTQNSQEDEGILKKSSLTDIWRKKWNPAKKTEEGVPSSVKQCLLSRCSGVLNKMIVQAMDGYSLISYFALQCFNLLQN